MNIYCFSTLSFAKLQFKSVINKAFHKHGVASFTDAWIETLPSAQQWRAFGVASFTDAWIETSVVIQRLYVFLSHLLQMRGLKRRKLSNGYKFSCRRIFYRCVDWNEVTMPLICLNTLGRIFYRCVDWNEVTLIGINVAKMSHLLQMRGLKHLWH